jgi:multiple sugar transport system substrate-binding protein
MTSLIDKGYAPPFAAVSSGVGMNELFAAGKYAMVMDGDWNIAGYLGLEGVEVDFAPTPVGPTGERASVFNGLADSIYIGSDNKPAAWEWVKFLASSDCQDIVADNAIVFPAVKSSLDKAVKAFEEKGVDISAFTVHVEDGTTHLAPITFSSQQVEKIMGPQMQRIFLGEGEVEDTLESANEQVNNLFD